MPRRDSGYRLNVASNVSNMLPLTLMVILSVLKLVLLFAVELMQSFVGNGFEHPFNSIIVSFCSVSLHGPHEVLYFLKLKDKKFHVLKSIDKDTMRRQCRNRHLTVLEQSLEKLPLFVAEKKCISLNPKCYGLRLNMTIFLFGVEN